MNDGITTNLQMSLFKATSAFVQTPGPPPEVPPSVISASPAEQFAKIASLIEDGLDASDELGAELLQEALELARKNA